MNIYNFFIHSGRLTDNSPLYLSYSTHPLVKTREFVDFKGYGSNLLVKKISPQ